MMMAACYANYDMALSHSLPSQHAHHMQQQEQAQQHQQTHHQQQQQQQSQHQTRISSVAELLAAASSSIVAQQKDYSVPLHVDCSVEYELPNQPKPPAGQRIEPLLMIHPCYFRKMESQRRSPFINNMPSSSRNSALLLSSSSSTSSTSVSSSRRSTRQSQQQIIANSSSLVNQESQYQNLHSVQNQSHLINQQIQHQQQQLTQQARYPLIPNIQTHQPTTLTSASNNDYSERAVRRATIIQTRAVNQQYQQQQQQQQLQKQQQIPQWDKIASTSLGMISSISTNPSTTTHSLSAVPTMNLVGKASNYSKPVGKRDAMISGECSNNNIVTNNNNCNNTTNNLNNNRNNFSNQCNNNSSNNNNNNNRINNSNNITKINNGNSASCTSLIDSHSTTNLRMWDASNSLIVHRSPMATVPSNYQAGPETTSTSIINNTAYNSSSSSSPSTLLNRCGVDNGDKISGKYRQYLKSHRIHPYIMSSNSSNLGSSYSQLSAVSNFPHHHQQMQQMSCYNV